MIKKLLKFKIIFSAVILMAGFISVCPVRAQSTDILDIEFETGLDSGTGFFNPLFSQANILPGESVTRWVEVFNKSGEAVPIAAKAVNAVDNGLASALILTITEQGVGIPAYDANLADFFGMDGVFLSDLAPGSTAVYDFNVNFEQSSGNEYNNKNNENNERNLTFDIVVGDGTDESFGGESSGGSTGGGGYYYQALNISDEQVIRVTDTAAVVIWITNKPATSRVIYDDDSHPVINDTDSPNYSYEFSTIEQDTGAQRTEIHSVNISGLTALTTYYFRPLSKASPEKYGQELSFTTTAGPDEVIVLGGEYAPDLSEEEKESPFVLGWEGAFAASGFSIKEFIILIVLLLLFSGLSIGLKRKYFKK
ncbi:hypothetical protein DRH27_04165 [Candidatus Falkowbacteria bacterium]|nr:MAG: hypothetical protein DRH27_04165 [Candidatus Falkowbacteria bacterium]